MQTATKMIAVIDLIPLILFFLLKLIIIITKKNITIPIKNIIQNSNIEIGNKEEILPIIFSYKKPKFLVHHSANSTLLFKIDKQINNNMPKAIKTIFIISLTEKYLEDFIFLF